MPKRRKNIAIDPITELERIRAQRQLAAQRRKYRSRLDKYRHDLLALRGSGASAADLRVWLRGQRVEVAESTIRRWLHAQAEREARRAACAVVLPSEQLQLTLFVDGGGDHGERQP